MSGDVTKSRSQGYRPRSVRSGNPPPFQLTQRDIEIIRLVEKYRFLNSDHIRDLVEGSHKNITNRLKVLFEHGLLDRPGCQYDTYRLGGGTSPLVYALAEKGARELASENVVVKHVSWSYKNKNAGRPFLQHTLAIADFATSLQVAVSRRDEVELIDNEALVNDLPTKTQALSKPYRLNIPVIYQGVRMDIGVEPDYAFALYLPQIRKRAQFLVEIDRGTMPVKRRDLKQSSILRKLFAYQTMWKMKRHNDHFGWGNFRVLFVTTSAERVENMIEAVNSQAITMNSPLFLFADKQSLYGDGDMFRKQWLGADSQLQHLLLKNT